jgi:hypothetical protein
MSVRLRIHLRENAHRREYTKDTSIIGDAGGCAAGKISPTFGKQGLWRGRSKVAPVLRIQVRDSDRMNRKNRMVRKITEWEDTEPVNQALECGEQLGRSLTAHLQCIPFLFLLFILSKNLYCTFYPCFEFGPWLGVILFGKTFKAEYEARRLGLNLVG